MFGYIVVRRAVLPEDEGRQHIVRSFNSLVKAQQWIADQVGQYHPPGDYYVAVEVKPPPQLWLLNWDDLVKAVVRAPDAATAVRLLVQEYNLPADGWEFEVLSDDGEVGIVIESDRRP